MDTSNIWTYLLFLVVLVVIYYRKTVVISKVNIKNFKIMYDKTFIIYALNMHYKHQFMQLIATYQIG